MITLRVMNERPIPDNKCVSRNIDRGDITELLPGQARLELLSHSSVKLST